IDTMDLSAIDDFANKSLKNDAMSIALSWINSKDYSFGALDVLVQGMADIDGSGNISTEEEDYYNQLFMTVGDALALLGADADGIASFLNDEKDEAGLKIGEFLSAKMDEIQDDDDTIISNFVVSTDQIFESMKKVIRGGVKTWVKKKIRPKKISSAQRMALKQARLKAHTATAIRARKKSMKIRKKMGM
ncbi:MAG: hypothetical protein HQK79_23040, partial [Desulfobacterales bacterium]|nr:hypothetical protein [Desulfobacterales bacterium]